MQKEKQAMRKRQSRVLGGTEACSCASTSTACDVLPLPFRGERRPLQVLVSGDLVPISAFTLFMEEHQLCRKFSPRVKALNADCVLS